MARALAGSNGEKIAVSSGPDSARAGEPGPEWRQALPIDLFHTFSPARARMKGTTRVPIIAQEDRTWHLNN